MNKPQIDHIREIPADVEVTMTDELRRLFLAKKCNPTCHVCKRRVAIGERFMLAEVLGNDEMLGACCTKEQLVTLRVKQKAVAKKQEEEFKAYKRSHPGFTRQHDPRYWPEDGGSI